MRWLRTARHAFIINLAIADLIMGKTINLAIADLFMGGTHWDTHGGQTWGHT